MKGTEKQIAWAQDIYNEAAKNINSSIAQYTEKYEQYDHHPAFAANVAAYKIMAAVLDGIFAAHDDAEYIINHRAALTNFNGIVSRWAEQIRTGKMTAEQIAAQNGIKNYKED